MGVPGPSACIRATMTSDPLLLKRAIEANGYGCTGCAACRMTALKAGLGSPLRSKSKG
jgi:hypothetical protein